MSRDPARSRAAMAVRMTSAGSRPASSAACRVRYSQRAWCESGWRWPGGSAAGDQVAVAVVTGGLGFGGPDRVQGGEVVGVGQVALPGHGGGLFGAVAVEDVGEHGDGLALARRVRAARQGLVGEVSRAFAAKTLVAVEFGGGSAAGLWVGGPGRGGEDEGEVDIGAAGQCGVEPLPVFGAGDQGDAGVHGGALGGVPGYRVGEVRCLVAVVAEGTVCELALSGGRIGVEHPADHDAAAGNGLDPQDVAVGQGPAGLARLEAVVVGPADDQVPGRGLAAVGDPDGTAVVYEAEVDQVVANPGGQFAAAGPVRGHEQDGAAGQVGGEVGAGALVYGLIRWGAADAAVLVVLVQRGAVAGRRRSEAARSQAAVNRTGSASWT